MFFILSKTVGFFLLPTNFLSSLLVLGLVLGKTRFAQRGRLIVTGAIVTLVIMAFSPLGNWILLPLEQRFSPSDINQLPPALHGIIVLGGSIDTVVTRARGSVAINEAAERLTETVRLARHFPNADIIFSGGSGRIIYEGMSEADASLNFFSQMGISPKRLILENKSKNTWQNARFTKALLKSKSNQRWLLVTSAFHMPRAIGCFRRNGLDVIPWPVDYRTRGNSDLYRFFNRASEGWKRTDIALREWIGLVVYRLSRRTNSFFPSSDTSGLGNDRE